jgi:hypothetical protein
MNLAIGAVRPDMQDLIDFVQNSHTKRVCNMDKVGSKESGDRKPRVWTEETIQGPAKRRGRCVSIIVTVSMAQNVTTRLLLIH